MKLHWAVLINNNSDTSGFLEDLENGYFPEPLSHLKHQKGALFSKVTLERFMTEEERHENRVIDHIAQPLRSLSSGEQKRALLKYIFDLEPSYVVLDNPFDNLDAPFVEEMVQMLTARAETIQFIQMISRKKDVLPFINQFAQLEKGAFNILRILPEEGNKKPLPKTLQAIPGPVHDHPAQQGPLIVFKDVHVAYGNKAILQAINWRVAPGEFWQLKGPNGSGKSTILSMITGDNPKAFGQDIHLFGKKKGSGESVWDIKKNIGYFSPIMTDKFSGRHSVEHMLISGLTDSIGLYVRPTETQERCAQEWLHLLGLQRERNTHFHALTPGKQRLVMTARAMVKHPPLLILDEPTAGLDDASASFFVQLVNTFAAQSSSAVIFVSHREEPGLRPKAILELVPGPEGSRGTVQKGK